MLTKLYFLAPLATLVLHLFFQSSWSNRIWFHGDFLVVLQDGTQLMLSRRYRDKLHAALGRPL